MILMFNNGNQYIPDKRTFSVIDPNGGETLVGSLDDSKVIKMLEHILSPEITYKDVEMPPCQKLSYRIPGSCLLWSQLYMELILRFGFTNDKLITEFYPKKGYIR